MTAKRVDTEFLISGGMKCTGLLPLCSLVRIHDDRDERGGRFTQHLQSWAGEHGWE